MSKQFSSQALWRHKEKLVSGSLITSMEGLRNKWRVFPLVRRPVGRTFYGAGKRLPFHPNDFYPFGESSKITSAEEAEAALGISEEWYGNCGETNTGNKNPEDDGKPFFREGQAHIIDHDGDLISTQELIEEDPDFMIGEATIEIAQDWFSEVTLPIYDKHFDPDRVLMDHRHNIKWEYYNFDPLNNKRPPTPDQHTTAIGYYPWVTPEMVLKALHEFGKGNSMELRRLQPHVLMPVGWGFATPNGVDHAPTNYCTQEPQARYDEHLLVEDKCGERDLSWDIAWSAVRNEDYSPEDRNWETVIEKTDWDLVTDPNFVKKHQCLPVLDQKRTEDGDGTVTWVIYGNIRGDQMASTQRIVIPPKGRHVLYHPSWSICHALQGQGNIGGMKMKFEPRARIGQLTYDRWFTPYKNAIAPEGIEVVNTSRTKDLVFKCTFGPNAFPDGEQPVLG
jgi:hypothetical protein